MLCLSINTIQTEILRMWKIIEDLAKEVKVNILCKAADGDAKMLSAIGVFSSIRLLFKIPIILH